MVFKYVMVQLDDIASLIEDDLDEKEAVREIALKSSRNIVRLCGRAIRAIHLDGEVEGPLHEARDELHRLISVSNGFPDIKHSGAVESAMQEYVEASLLYSIHKGTEIPTPESLCVTPEAYILGVGDLIGEVRRITIDSIRKGEVRKASDHLDLMEHLFEFLMRFHYPSGLVAIKRKQDVGRGILEKTRGDVAVAVRSHALEMLLDKKGG